MIRKLLFSIAIVSLISSCKQESAFREVKVNNLYSISTPDYMQPCVDLHKDASYQYQNTDKDIYAIVIDERKKTMANYDLDYDLDLYFKTASQPILETLKEGKMSAVANKEINGNKAMVSEINGKFDEIDTYYKIGVIETPYAFYQILTWTRADKKVEYEPDMNTMIDSFKELPQPETELPEAPEQEQEHAPDSVATDTAK